MRLGTADGHFCLPPKKIVIIVTINITIMYIIVLL